MIVSMSDRLEAEFAARNLIARYALLLDARKIEAVAALFAEDAVLTVMGQTYAGRAMVEQWVRSLAANPPGKHMASNTYVEHDGDVRATSDFIFCVPADGQWRCAVGGRYNDSFRKVGDEWFIWRRDIEIDTRGRG
jgi:ketosteroid isomerase-like protein